MGIEAELVQGGRVEAKIVDHDVAANWKLVWENNRVGYHCNVNHPQCLKANFNHFNNIDPTPRVQERIAAKDDRVKVREVSELMLDEN